MDTACPLAGMQLTLASDISISGAEWPSFRIRSGCYRVARTTVDQTRVAARKGCEGGRAKRVRSAGVEGKRVRRTHRRDVDCRDASVGARLRQACGRTGRAPGTFDDVETRYRAEARSLADEEAAFENVRRCIAA
jgi:hypothetical protein